MARRQPGEPLYDYPVSYTFRAYEAEIDEGIQLPALESREQEYLMEIEELRARLDLLEGRRVNIRTVIERHYPATKGRF